MTHDYRDSAYRLMESALFELMSVDPSRSNSLAKTNLEQAMMWCKRDIDEKRVPDDPGHPGEPPVAQEDR